MQGNKVNQIKVIPKTPIPVNRKEIPKRNKWVETLVPTAFLVVIPIFAWTACLAFAAVVDKAE